MENHSKSLRKRARRQGFLVRQSTKKGRAIHSRKRRAGRSVNVRKSFS
ncbi:MAG: 50S ribosomal protein L34 [Anaerohalosphaeraceae bacterium]